MRSGHCGECKKTIKTSCSACGERMKRAIHLNRDDRRGGLARFECKRCIKGSPMKGPVLSTCHSQSTTAEMHLSLAATNQEPASNKLGDCPAGYTLAWPFRHQSNPGWLHKAEFTRQSNYLPHRCKYCIATSLERSAVGDLPQTPSCNRRVPCRYECSSLSSAVVRGVVAGPFHASWM